VPRSTDGESALRVVLVYPDLLGTYGDSGNAVVLAQRWRWRGHRAELITIEAGRAVPATADLYVIGGGEDLPQAMASRALAEGRPLHRAVSDGAAVLAVCAGLQELGTSVAGPDGVERAGLGLLDVATGRGRGPRAVGELVVEPTAESPLPLLTGFENHGAVTALGPGVRPAGRVVSGVGNGTGDGLEGAVSGRIWGTYLHGPVLARNPQLADLLLGWVAGPLPPLDDSEIEALRAERLRAAIGRGRGAWRRWRRRS
jgi:CobQ-like glutamine amidotransferase family enzyme